MYEEDYVKRVIRQLGAAVAQLLRWARAGDIGAARREVDYVLGDLFGVSPSMILTLAEEAVLDLIFRGEPADPERVAILADVLRINGDITAAEGRPDQALPWYQASLRYLARAVETMGLLPSPERLESAEILVHKLSPDGLAPELLASLYALYRGQGRHALASELIVAFAEKTRPAAEGLQEAEAYLRELIRMRDEELKECGLTREHVLRMIVRVSSQPASGRTGAPSPDR